jgi:hypothetical protein
MMGTQSRHACTQSQSESRLRCGVEHHQAKHAQQNELPVTEPTAKTARLAPDCQGYRDMQANLERNLQSPVHPHSLANSQ